MIVVDASVAFKWFNPENEEFRDKSLAILKKHRDKKEMIIVPSLLFMEVANALVTKAKADSNTIKENLDLLNDAELQIYSFKKIDLIESAIEAFKYKTTFYDMLYAVVAKRNKCNLVTADDNFIKKTGFRHVRHIRDFT